LAKMRLQRRTSALPEAYTSGTIEFLTALRPETLVSNYFQTKVNDVLYNVYIQDYDDSEIVDEDGTGTLKLVDIATGNVVHSNVGTVDYKSGKVFLNSLWVNSFYGSSTSLHLTVTPQELSKNITPGIINTSEISTHAIAPLPSKNTVLLLDNSSADRASNLLPGLSIRATPHFATE